MNRQVTFSQLTQSLSKSTGVTTNVAGVFLQELFVEIAQSLIRDERREVTINGLGTFRYSFTDETNDVIVDFVPDKDLADALNQPFSQFGPVKIEDTFDLSQLRSIDNEDSSDGNSEENVIFNEPSDVDGSESQSAQEMQSLSALAAMIGGVGAGPELTEKESEPIVSDAKSQSAETGEPKLEEQVQTSQNTIQEIEQHVEDTGQDAESELSSVQDNSNQPKNKSNKWIWWAAAALVSVIAILSLTWVYRNQSGELLAEGNIADSVADTQSPAAPPQVIDTIKDNHPWATVSKEHYGSEAFWGYIYEENRQRVGHIKMVKSGTLIVIPPPEKYGINKDDPESVRKGYIVIDSLAREFKLGQYASKPHKAKKSLSSGKYKKRSSQRHRHKR